MRNMAFSLTTPQMRNRTKTVTRRSVDTWHDLKAGDVLMAVVKSRGLRKGEYVEEIGPIRIVSVRVERLYEITLDDIAREGFPGMGRPEFCRFYMEGTKGATPDMRVRRIEFTPLYD